MIIDKKIRAFTRNWRNPGDFPVTEEDESTVRYDMQYLFDELKDAVNSLIDGIFAENIPFRRSLGIPADNVQSAVAEVKRQLDEAVIGTAVPDGSITAPKLASGAVETSKLAYSAVTPEKSSGLQREKILKSGVSLSFQNGAASYYDEDVTEGCFALALPSDGCFESWREHSVRLSLISPGELSFSAEVSFSGELSADILLLP